jgi:TRAP transporter TAXI family solute receptor
MTGQSSARPIDRLPPVVSHAVLALTLACAILPIAARAEDEVFASVGTGQLNGIYYPIGKAICQIVNRDLHRHGVRCSPEATPGSIYNVAALKSGELEFAIVQSDVQFAAYHGEDTWTGKAFSGLRSVFSLYPELVTIIARGDAHIRQLPELSGRRMNVGSQGSGIRTTWDAIEAQLGWSNQQQVRQTGLKGDASIAALCNGAIDASMMIIGHPSSLVRSQLDACAANLVAITGPAIDKLIHSRPYYRSETIPTNDYGIAADVPTFGGRAVLVTSASVDARVVAVVAKTVVAHIAELRTLNPVLARLSPREMTTEGLMAPLHPGAAEAYKTLDLQE